LVLELPRTIYYETKEQGLLVGILVGFLAGFGLGMRRTVVGAYELLTFPIAPPDDYKPILSHRFPFEQGRTKVSPALIRRPKDATEP
jgi:putative exosortase-associated protein (TIGR04073 family)